MPEDAIEVTLIAESGIIALVLCLQLVVMFAMWYVLKEIRDKTEYMRGEPGPPGPQGAVGPPGAPAPVMRDEPPKTLTDKDINGWE